MNSYYKISTRDLFRKLTNTESSGEFLYRKERSLYDSYGVLSDSKKNIPPYLALRYIKNKHHSNKMEYVEVFTFSKIVDLSHFLDGVGLFYRISPKEISEEEYKIIIESWQDEVLRDTLKKFLINARRAYLDLAVKTITIRESGNKKTN